VTDVHVGRFTDGPQLTHIVEATNKLRADFVLMTGDLINNSISDLPAALDAVKRMDARFGVYMCEGNHDLFDGRLAFEQGVTSAGVPLLVDDATTVRARGGHPVQLLGLRWGAPGLTRRSPGGDEALAITVPPLLARREPDAFPILLAHHPHAFDFAAQSDIPLTLAGHTHGGQLMLTRNLGFGRVYRYWSGLYTKGVSSLVVSNGVGNWFPLRVNAPAEIVHVTLRQA
jgi:predicted MPP superfamily phosphohydrolase